MAGAAAVQKKQEELEQEWWPRDEAAKRLGVSVRTLRKLGQAGRVRRQMIPAGPEHPYQSMVYHAGDLMAYKAQAAAAAAPRLIPAAPSIHTPAALLAPALPVEEALTIFAEKLGERLAQQLPQQPARVPRWLTLEAAAAYSGLPRAHLLRLTRDDNDVVLNVGTADAPRWRFDRDEL